MKLEAYVYDPESEESLRIYNQILSWDEDAFPPGELLPKLGVLTRDESGEILCYVCADMSNSIPRAMVDYLMTNPDISPTKRYKAVKLAEEFICKRLKELGYTYIIGVSRHAGVAALSQSLGYEVLLKPVIEFNKVI